VLTKFGERRCVQITFVILVSAVSSRWPTIAYTLALLAFAFVAAHAQLRDGKRTLIFRSWSPPFILGFHIYPAFNPWSRLRGEESNFSGRGRLRQPRLEFAPLTRRHCLLPFGQYRAGEVGGGGGGGGGATGATRQGSLLRLLLASLVNKLCLGSRSAVEVMYLCQGFVPNPARIRGRSRGEKVWGAEGKSDS